jgi:hypothetical protein
MAKRNNQKELMASRNPLKRASVAPVDIYSQPPVAAEPAAPVETTPKEAPKQTAAKKPEATAPKKAVKKNDSEKPLPYSTHLYREQIKGVKLRAIEQGTKDQEIVQAALDEYFKNHPL